MIHIPPERLSTDALDALIEEFVTRHGTDLTDAASKADQVRAQLRAGQVIIVWDQASESANILPTDSKEGPAPLDDGERRIEYDEPPPRAQDDY
jgi:uncharacterized protein